MAEAGTTMAQPPEYEITTNFSDYQDSNPTDPLPAASIDVEFNNIKTTLDAINTNLALIQADDGDLANDIVGSDQIDDALEALLDAASLAAEIAEVQAAKTAAQTAQTGAETAQTAAETAQTAAETAQTAAETAQTAAEAAAALAEAGQVAFSLYASANYY